MIRTHLRTLAVAAGFLGVSVIVAGTASAMAGAPDTAPVATAVELHQEDPASVTPAVVAAVASAEPSDETVTAVEVGPVEVGPGAIECSDEGVCEGQRRQASGPVVSGQAERPVVSGQAERPVAAVPEPKPAPAAPSSCTLPPPPDGRADVGAWTRELDEWAEDRHEAARDCDWGTGSGRDAMDDPAWADAWEERLRDWQRERNADHQRGESRNRR
ncbi:hypothetical protein ACNI3K_04060 [Demequina sp. SO4-13]|uniref:hypothetical protein n=1 Tax=Demequina sp. SO4-13 TaxID=3401027 RepID=UPI003AF83423